MTKRDAIPAPTPEDLALDLSAVWARAEAATPGEWKWEDWQHTTGDPDYGRWLDTLIAPRDTSADPEWSKDLGTKVLSTDDPLEYRQEDLAFIAAARTDVPAALRLAAHWKKRAAYFQFGLDHAVNAIGIHESEAARLRARIEELEREAGKWSAP